MQHFLNKKPALPPVFFFFLNMYTLLIIQSLVESLAPVKACMESLLILFLARGKKKRLNIKFPWRTVCRRIRDHQSLPPISYLHILH